MDQLEDYPLETPESLLTSKSTTISSSSSKVESTTFVPHTQSILLRSGKNSNDDNVVDKLRNEIKEIEEKMSAMTLSKSQKKRQKLKLKKKRQVLKQELLLSGEGLSPTKKKPCLEKERKEEEEEEEEE